MIRKQKQKQQKNIQLLLCLTLTLIISGDNLCKCDNKINNYNIIRNKAIRLFQQQSFIYESHLINNNNIITIPIDINKYQQDQQIPSHIINSTGVALIEITINPSNQSYSNQLQSLNVYILDQSTQNVDRLHTKDGIHYYTYRNNLKDNQIYIVISSDNQYDGDIINNKNNVLNQSMIYKILRNNNQQFINQQDQRDQQKYNNKDIIAVVGDYKIDVIPYEYHLCPFDCFNQGICQSNGECLCNTGYSLFNNCSVQTYNYLQLSIHKWIKIYHQDEYINNYENKTNNNKMLYSEITFDEEIKNILNESQLYGKEEKTIQLQFDCLALPGLINNIKQLSLIIIKDQIQSYSILDDINNNNNQKDNLVLKGHSYINQQNKNNIQQEIIRINYKISSEQLQKLYINKSIELILGYNGFYSIDMKLEIVKSSNNHHSASAYINIYIIILAILLFFITICYILFNKNDYIQNNHQILPLNQQNNNSNNTIIQVNSQNNNSHFFRLLSYIMSKQIQIDEDDDLNNRINYNMPIFLYKKPSWISELNQTFQECHICLSKYNELDECRITKCQHVFHKECIDLWLSKKQVCPIDRTPLIHSE